MYIYIYGEPFGATNGNPQRGNQKVGLGQGLLLALRLALSTRRAKKGNSWPQSAQNELDGICFPATKSDSFG